MRKRAFISHISTETELAIGLKARLERDFLEMLDIFVSSDRHTIQAGRKWLDEVDQALKDADIQIVLCSTQSVGRPWVNFEAGAAWLRGIPVIPTCHSGLVPEQLPVPLSMLEAIECGRPEGLQKLYDAVASVLGTATPVIDFRIAAAEVNEFEEAYRQKTEAVDVVNDPHILCAASEQYSRLDFDLDVAVLESTFGSERVTVERRLSRRRFTEILSAGRFEIIHLVIAVDPATGDLLFSPIDTVKGSPATATVDKMSAASFAELLAESQTRLVVLATCNALLLAVEVSHVANMAASDADIAGRDAAEWADVFYRLVASGKSVHRAFEITRPMVDVPIRTIRHADVAFTISKP